MYAANCLWKLVLLVSVKVFFPLIFIYHVFVHVCVCVYNVLLYISKTL